MPVFQRIARRIDAALAEQGTSLSLVKIMHIEEMKMREKAEAALAEREAQIAALRQVVQDFVTYAHRGNVSISGLVFEEANHVLADTARAADAFVERIRACVTQLVGALRGLRRSHYICDEDCWYSCPESGECCNEKATGCNCGANEVNATIDTALAAAEKLPG